MNIKASVKKLFRKSKVTYCPVMSLENSSMLKNKTVFITGGSSGIGREIAMKAVSYGAKVIIAGRNEEKLREVSEKLGGVQYVVSDLKDDIEKDFFENLESIIGSKITCLVNNAGIYVDYSSLNYSTGDFDRVFTTNVKAPFFLSQEYVRYCIKKQIKGNIVFTSSNRSLMGDDGPYGMSKAAINNLIEGFAREHICDGIRINGVAPGMTASAINGIDVNGNMSSSSVKGNRVIHPLEIAEIVCFLLSDVSQCITGAIIPCDNGDRLR